MFIHFKPCLFLVVACFLMAGCQEDLFPSNDQLPANSVAQVGSTIEDFSFSLTSEENQNLSDRLQNSDAVVLYFTMWCPVCDSHMSHIRRNVRPDYPNVDFIFVDYVSGSIGSSLSAQDASGYTDFDVIADTNDELQNLLGGNMSITLVIDKNFIIQMNEEFNTGITLKETLNLLSE